MTATTVHSFAHAAEQAQQWVNELCADLGWSERRAYRLLRSVLHTLRDWLQPDEMADLAAQLPTLVRGVYFEGWGPSEAPPAERGKADFIARIDADFAEDIIHDTEADARCSGQSLRSDLRIDARTWTISPLDTWRSRRRNTAAIATSVS